MTLEPEEAQHAALEAELQSLYGHFMQPEIERGGYFEIETSDGTEVVPSDVIGRTVGTHVEAFENYLSGKPYDSDEVVECKYGWLARMNAPGYMDCTSWNAFEPWDTAAKYLIDTFGDV